MSWWKNPLFCNPFKSNIFSTYLNKLFSHEISFIFSSSITVSTCSFFFLLDEKPWARTWSSKFSPYFTSPAAYKAFLFLQPTDIKLISVTQIHKSDSLLHHFFEASKNFYTSEALCRAPESKSNLRQVFLSSLICSFVHQFLNFMHKTLKWWCF